MTAKKRYCTHGGKAYVSVPEAARLIGTTATKLKEIAVAEGLHFQNFRANGRLWIGAEDINAYLVRHGAIAVIPSGNKRPTKVWITPLTESNTRLLPRLLK